MKEEGKPRGMGWMESREGAKNAVGWVRL